MVKKRCNKCSLTLSAHEFCKNRRKKDGLNHQCRACRRKYNCRTAPHQRKMAMNWHYENIARRRQHDSQYYQDNGVRIKKWIVEYQRQNKKRMRAINRQYTLAKIHRIPQWLTPEQRRQIINFYINCPKGMTVDHIIPLQGKYISGLHHPDNLQYLTLKENCCKHNRCPDVDKLWE